MSKKNNLDEEGLGDIIRERDQRLLDLYKEINNPKDPGRNEQFLKERSKKEIFSGELSNMERTDTYEAQIAGHEQLEIDLNAGRDGTTIFKDDTLKEFNKANQPIQRMYQLGRAVAPDQVDALFELLEGKIGGALRLLPLDKTKGLLREQRDLPKDNPDPKFQLVKDPYPKDHLMYGTDLEDKESLPDITWPTKPSE